MSDVSGKKMAPVITVASGKGGVGKSTVVANIAVALAKLGRRVLVLDADFSLANMDVLLGLAPKFTIQHFFTGECDLEDLLVEGPLGIRVIPAASGISDLTRIDDTRRRALLERLESLRAGNDHLLIDAPAGIGDNVIQLAAASDRTLIVVSPEPTSLVDAYATIKVIAGSGGMGRIGLIVNGTAGAEETERVHGQIDRVCRRFLGAGVPLSGQVLHDVNVQIAVRDQVPVVQSHPHSPAARCFSRIAMRLVRERGAERADLRPMFWQRLLDSVDETQLH